jgi:allantoate deiminase/N-carbamoyl-L-amino-acid hydrolase
MTATIELSALNALDEAGFVAALDGIFEHSPWVAADTAAARPFANRLQLADALCATMYAASRDRQLALVRAHPELAGRAAIGGMLTADSAREQAGAGLDRCTPEEYARLQSLNAAYNARFGFPFVLAVKGHDRRSILVQLAQRLQQEPEAEFATALAEIARIAGFRLAGRVTEPAATTVQAMAERLAAYSDAPGMLSCTYLRPAHRATASQLREWMLQAGLDAHIDAIGNVIGRWRCGRADAKTLMTGSHYDTVIDGGRYDGRLGILLPIVVAQQLRLAGVQLDYDLEIVAFSEEEGVRFASTFLGSSAVAGQFDADALERRDADGITLREALLDAGRQPRDIAAIARDPARLLGFVEVHIEQGPVLLDEGRALGVVTAINGSLRYRIRVTGQAGHAGTVPMQRRRDAAAAAAEIVLFVERRCRQTPELVGTVGCLQVPHGAVNVIPGACELSLDLRAPDDALRDAAAGDVRAEIARIAAARGVEIEVEELLRAPATRCAPAMQARLAASICRVTGDAQARRLPSGAGHDAMQLARITAIGMLFVRCGAGGISHHPAETVSEADMALAATAFADFLQSFCEP